MTITIETITDEMIQLNGMVNTAGEPEAYRVKTLWNGQKEVFVQRKNGKFAILNPNVHSETCFRVIRTAKELAA